MCISEGTLRAKLDGELSRAESLAIDNHLLNCSSCQQRTKALQAQAERIGSFLAVLSPGEDEQPSQARLALARFRRRQHFAPATKSSPIVAILAWCGRILTGSVKIPIPIAVLVVITLAGLFWLVVQQPTPTITTSLPVVPDPPQIVEVPVVQEKIVYVESRTTKNSPRALHKSTDSLHYCLTSHEFEDQLRKMEKRFLSQSINKLNNNLIPNIRDIDYGAPFSKIQLRVGTGIPFQTNFRSEKFFLPVRSDERKPLNNLFSFPDKYIVPISKPDQYQF
ncbi:MAG: zf-HC2 domain-containing protein [Acidobacteriota bacterium]